MTVSKTEKTIKAYNKNASKYNSKFKDYETYRDKVTDFHGRCIPQGATVLDLGCGPGNNITIIKSLDGTCRFTGIDLSEDLLAIAKKLHPESTFIQRNICDLNALDFGCFNTILASFCIVHLNDEEAEGVIKYVAEHLVDGGSLYLSFMEGKTPGFESTSFSDEEIYFNYYQRDFILTLLEDNGLHVEVVSEEGYQEQDGSITSDIFIFATRV